MSKLYRNRHRRAPCTKVEKVLDLLKGGDPAPFLPKRLHGTYMRVVRSEARTTARQFVHRARTVGPSSTKAHSAVVLASLWSSLRTTLAILGPARLIKVVDEHCACAQVYMCCFVWSLREA